MNSLNESLKYKTLVCDWPGDKVVHIMSETSYCRVDVYEGEKHVAYLSGLYVVEIARNRGEGKELISFAQRIARVLGCTEVQLRVDETGWLSDWYKSLGFEVLPAPQWLQKTL